MKVLKLNSKCRDVKALLRFLNLKEDGMFGPKTEEVVKKWLKEHNLTPDGIVGNKTWLSLLKENDLLSEMISTSIKYDVELSVLEAVKKVESNGKAFVDGIPTMLFEGHIFWKQLQSRKINPTTYVKGNEDILYSKWTKSHYTGKNLGEYVRLLKAIKINEAAAYESASYGMFQIMGNNYKICGFNSAKEMYEAMCKSEVEQFKIFVQFIKSRNLIKYLKEKNWAMFAKLYNGPAYKENKYDIKLKNAYVE